MGLTLGIIQVVLFGGSIAAYYSTGISEPEPVTIAGTATLDNTNDDLFFTPVPGLSPAPMTDSWEWTVERGGTTIMSWTSETTDMEVWKTITLSTSASAVSVGDELKIKVGKRVFVTSIGAE